MPFGREMFGRHSFDARKDYMTSAEMKTFESMRNSGELTYFREMPCKGCGRPILKGKLFCSKKCKEDFMSDWKWDIDLENLIGLRFLIETSDGIYREGVLTQIRWKELTLDGSVVRYPEVFQLDKDSANEFDSNRIVNMERVIE